MSGVSGKSSDAVQMEKAIEDDDALRELHKLRSENERLKKMYADLSMDHEVLREGYELAKKYAAQDAGKK
jgi:putative transposase